MKKPSHKSAATGEMAIYCETAKGILMAIGGNEDKGKNRSPGSYHHDVEEKNQMRILSYFCELTGKNNPKIAVITTASTQPEKAFPNYRSAFKKLGLSEVQHVHDTDRKEAVQNKHQEVLSVADAIIFSGGDQLRLTSIYGGSALVELLTKRYHEEQIVLAGTSAGAMAFSGLMIFQAEHSIDVHKGGVQLTAGFNFLPWASIDTHFTERRRLSRLVQVLATNPGYSGFGIEEDTAIIVRKGEEIEVAGNGTVLILEGYKSHCTNIAEVANGDLISIRDLQMHQLIAGDFFTRTTLIS